MLSLNEKTGLANFGPGDRMSKAEALVFAGVVCETLPNTMFLVKLENSREVVATLSEAFRPVDIVPGAGDRVLIESMPYDLARGSITLLID
jgi:translation initiation factor IF-1